MATDIRKRLSSRVRELRARCEMTQQSLAEAADIDYKSIQRIEAKNPKFYPKLDTLEKLAKALGVTLSEFLRFP